MIVNRFYFLPSNGQDSRCWAFECIKQYSDTPHYENVQFEVPKVDCERRFLLYLESYSIRTNVSSKLK